MLFCVKNVSSRRVQNSTSVTSMPGQSRQSAQIYDVGSMSAQIYNLSSISAQSHNLSSMSAQSFNLSSLLARALM